MLTKEILSNILSSEGVTEIQSDAQIIEAEGLDAIMELLMNLRGLDDGPCLVLEGRSNGSIQLIDGPVDTYTESIWVMERVGRGETESEVYARTFTLMKKILRALVAKVNLQQGMEGWRWQRTTYMKRYGGPDARGWEMVLTFMDDQDI